MIGLLIVSTLVVAGSGIGVSNTASPKRGYGSPIARQLSSQRATDTDIGRPAASHHGQEALTRQTRQTQSFVLGVSPPSVHRPQQPSMHLRTADRSPDPVSPSLPRGPRRAEPQQTGDLTPVPAVTRPSGPCNPPTSYQRISWPGIGVKVEFNITHPIPGHSGSDSGAALVARCSPSSAALSPERSGQLEGPGLSAGPGVSAMPGLVVHGMAFIGPYDWPPSYPGQSQPQNFAPPYAHEPPQQGSSGGFAGQPGSPYPHGPPMMGAGSPGRAGKLIPPKVHEPPAMRIAPPIRVEEPIIITINNKTYELQRSSLTSVRELSGNMTSQWKVLSATNMTDVMLSKDMLQELLIKHGIPLSALGQDGRHARSSNDHMSVKAYH